MAASNQLQLLLLKPVQDIGYDCRVSRQALIVFCDGLLTLELHQLKLLLRL